MPSFPGIDRGGALFSLVLAAAMTGWYLLDPAAFGEEIRGPQSFLLLGFATLLLVANVFEGVRESWLYGLLFGAFTLVWGVHNLSGPGTPYLTGYGFVVLGFAGAVHAVYRRVRAGQSRSDAA